MSALKDACLRELILSWRFVGKDFSTTFLSTCVLMIVAFSTSPPITLLDGIVSFLYGLLYVWLFIYSFCLSNQICGIEEDRINKPARPLPAGLVSIPGAWRRWIVVSSMFLFVGWFLDVLQWTILWGVVSGLLNFAGLARYWWFKNVVAMGVGNFAQLAAAWCIVSSPEQLPWRWLLVVSLWVGATSSTQDFRDVHGDAVCGRKTLPLLIGDKPARNLMAIVWVLVATAVHAFLENNVHGHDRMLLLCEILSWALHLLISARLVMYRAVQKDHITYIIYTYLYCLMVLSGVLIL